jgi:hypothetical protein
MARLVFTDTTGTATLDNALGAVAAGVASRFRAWTPFSNPVGPAKHALGTGALHKFVFRTDQGARFRLEEIPLLNLPVALRLMAHLLAGGTVRVETDDAQLRAYASCGLAPETVPELQLADTRGLTYALTLAVINLGTTEQMLCEYAGIPTPGAVLLVAGPDRLPGVTFTRASTATYATVG